MAPINFYKAFLILAVSLLMKLKFNRSRNSFTTRLLNGSVIRRKHFVDWTKKKDKKTRISKSRSRSSTSSGITITKGIETITATATTDV